jgi:hypothetical protein
MEFQMRNKTFISSMVGVAAAVAVAGSAHAVVVGTTLNTLSPASAMVANDSNSSGTASGGLLPLLYGISNSTEETVTISGGTVTMTATNASSSLSSFQARRSSVDVDLSAYSSGGIRFDYSAALAPSLAVKILVFTGSVAKTYTASPINEPMSATGFTLNWADFSDGSTSLSANLSYLTNVRYVQVDANGFGSSISFSNLEVVPAPGALALLGVAGIVGARRRRA